MPTPCRDKRMMPPISVVGGLTANKAPIEKVMENQAGIFFGRVCALQGNLPMQRRLVGVINTGKTRDFPAACLGVHPLGVPLLTHLQGGFHEDFHTVVPPTMLGHGPDTGVALQVTGAVGSLRKASPQLHGPAAIVLCFDLATAMVTTHP
jgi:hypothetical protein